MYRKVSLTYIRNRDLKRLSKVRLLKVVPCGAVSIESQFFLAQKQVSFPWVVMPATFLDLH